MNILLFVTTMIMILASLTYARIEMYRTFSIVQSQFNTYMQKTERSTTNQAAEWWYENNHASKVSKVKTPSSKNGSLSRLSFYIFLDPEYRKEHEKDYMAIHTLTKKLLYMLYREQPFFQKMELKYPDFVTMLLARIELQARLLKEQQTRQTTAVQQGPGQEQSQGKQQPKNKLFQKIEELGALDLQDNDFNETFTKMLKGTVAPEDKLQTQAQQKPLSTQQASEDPAENDDPEEEAGKKNEYHSPEGYYSLLDFITIKKANKIRVYLAPKLLLTAIFDDPETVKAIVDMRNNIYKQVINDNMAGDAATKQFEGAFASRVDPAFKDLLDFNVSKTNPQNYE